MSATAADGRSGHPDVLEPFGRGIRRHDHEVDPHVRSREVRGGGDVAEGGAADPAEAGGVERVERRLACRAGLHLGEDERVAEGDDEVEFAVAAAPAPGEDPAPAGFEVAGRRILRRKAGQVADPSARRSARA